MSRMLMTQILACPSQNAGTTSISGILKKTTASFHSNSRSLPVADCLLPHQIKRSPYFAKVCPQIAFSTVLICERSRHYEG